MAGKIDRPHSTATNRTHHFIFAENFREHPGNFQIVERLSACQCAKGFCQRMLALGFVPIIFGWLGVAKMTSQSVFDAASCREFSLASLAIWEVAKDFVTLFLGKFPKGKSA